MANPEHLEILKQGVEVWNRWRKENSDVLLDLKSADLSGARLEGAILDNAILVGANLSHTWLVDAGFYRACLDGANIAGAKLAGARLNYARLASARLDHAWLDGARLDHAWLDDASLAQTSLINASLVRTSLRRTNFYSAHLNGACLNGAKLDGASFIHTHLDGVNFDGTQVGGSRVEHEGLGGGISASRMSHIAPTVFVDVDLSRASSLESAEHLGPSHISTSTLERSRGQLRPAVLKFLKGCGLADWEIEAAKLYNPDLTDRDRTDIAYEIVRIQGSSPIQINPLFISYSHADTSFVEALGKRLDKKRVRYWRDVHDMKSGRIERQIDRAIRHNPTVLLILSEHSVESDWVEWEASKARKLEKELQRDVLCPIALDDAWKNCDWPGPLRRQVEDYHILDLSDWRDSEILGRQFQKLIDGLGLFYPKASGG